MRLFRFNNHDPFVFILELKLGGFLYKEGFRIEGQDPKFMACRTKVPANSIGLFLGKTLTRRVDIPQRRAMKRDTTILLVGEEVLYCHTEDVTLISDEEIERILSDGE